MSAGQVPMWVTFTLAVLALVGPLGGAWIGGRIAASRDDRRWEREARREDLRWHRERQRRHFDDKTEVYSDLISTLHYWMDALRDRTADAIFTPHRPPSVETLNQIEQSARKAAASVELLGSVDVVEAARRAVMLTTLANETSIAYEEGSIEVNSLSRYYEDARVSVEELRNVVRVEIDDDRQAS